MKKEVTSGKTEKKQKLEEQQVSREISPKEMEKVTGAGSLAWKSTGVRGGVK